MQEIGYWLINDIIWYKTNPTPNFMGTRLNNSHETLIWATKSQKAKYTFHYKTAKELNTDTVLVSDYEKGIRKQMGSIWRFPVCSGNERIKDDAGKNFTLRKNHLHYFTESLLYVQTSAIRFLIHLEEHLLPVRPPFNVEGIL